MDDLFAESAEGLPARDAPLAARMRPRSLDEFVGQRSVVGPGTPLRRMIESDAVPSLILYGPPGCGKTTLATIVARTTKRFFAHVNAVTAGVADVREVLVRARERRKMTGRGTILFLDEIAHFNKTQQDALMRDVEDGTIVLVGATTHNPSFFINGPLLSRARLVLFEPLEDADVESVLRAALADPERGLGGRGVEAAPEALARLAAAAGGDCRRALNALEACVAAAAPGPDGAVRVDSAAAAAAIGRAVRYDRDEEGHYDTISAFIKSMRGSDPDAAVYWLAVMLAGGEDPRFVARRIVICAAEDVGNADPQALVVAQAAFDAAAATGMPEARIILAQAAVYVATAPKSNASYLAVSRAAELVEKEGAAPVPPHLRQGGYRNAEKMGRGVGYLYPHDYPGRFVPQEYMPLRRKFYVPSDQGYEKRIAFFLAHIERLRKEHEKRAEAERSRPKKTPS